jgi:hypothetical protein
VELHGAPDSRCCDPSQKISDTPKVLTLLFARVRIRTILTTEAAR